MKPNELPGQKIQISFAHKQTTNRDNELGARVNSIWIMLIHKHMESNLDLYWIDYISAYINLYIKEINFNLLLKHIPSDIQHILKLYANTISSETIENNRTRLNPAQAEIEKTKREMILNSTGGRDWMSAFSSISSGGILKVPIFQRRESFELSFEDVRYYNTILHKVMALSSVWRKYFISLVN